MRRLPIKLRVTAAFAAAMAVLLGGLGLFVYLRSESNLDRTIDASLRSRARDIITQLDTPRGSLSREISRVLVQQTESFAQVLTPAGRPLAGVRRFNGEPLVAGAELERARHRSTLTEIPVVPGGEDPARLLAQPAGVGGRTVVVVTGRTHHDRND
jgi:hypothetical protein